MLISSIFWNITYCGMSSTWYGSRSVPIMIENIRFRPANLILAKAYAVSEQEMTMPTTEPSA